MRSSQDGAKRGPQNGLVRRRNEGRSALLGTNFLHFRLLFFPLVVPGAAATFLDLVALFAHINLYFANPVLLVSARNMKSTSLGFNRNPASRTDDHESQTLCADHAALGNVGRSIFPDLTTAIRNLITAGCLWAVLWLFPASTDAAETQATLSETNKAAAKAPKGKKKKKELATVRIHLETPRGGTERTEEIYVLRSAPMKLYVDKEPFLWEFYLLQAKLIPTDGGLPEIELQFNSGGRTLLENYTAANRGRRMVIGIQFDKERRWVAAPMISRLISNGTLRFTPDATAEEIERMVVGLNNIAEVKKKKDKF